MATDVQQVVIVALTTVASVSGALNMLFLKSVLGEIRDLRVARSEDRTKIEGNSKDIEWIKRQLPAT